VIEKMRIETFTDFDAFVGSNPQLDARWLMHGKGKWRSRSESVFAGDCWMMRRHSSTGFLGEGIGSADGYGFYIPDRSGLWTVNGADLDPDKIAVFEPGAEFSGYANSGIGWQLFFIPRHLVEGQEGLGRAANPYFYLVDNQQNVGDRVRSTFTRVFSAIAEHPSIESSPAMRMVEAELRSLLQPIIAAGVDGETSRNNDGGEPMRIQHNEIMHLSGRILDEHEDRPIHVSELAASIGVSERTLRRVFKKYYGIGPREYLLLRQLNKVRRKLLASDRDETTVTDVLTHWGVWEFGRFSGRYKRQFGELPSATLRRAPVAMQS
jgi:AraC-like DNA-binding protein